MEDLLFPADDTPTVQLQRGTCPDCGEERVLLRADGEPFTRHTKTLKHLLAVKRLKATAWPT